MTARRLDIQRIRVNKHGYDSSDVYWGAGPDVFIATSPDGSEEITVRARNVTEARAKVTAELARKPGEARSDEREPVGGNSPHKSRYEIDWLNPVTMENVRIRITHAREYLSSGSDHLEIESIKPKRAPLPITETGYRSHFMPALELINAGGPVTFVTAWIEQETKGKAWTTVAAIKAQGDLFSWAEAQNEIGKRAGGQHKPSKPKRPVPQELQQGRGKPSRRPKSDRSPA
ncbi:MAG: hypothetical protein ABL907_10380 [Hyphomicrobium sp.]